MLQSMGAWTGIPRIRRLFFWQEEEVLAGPASFLPRLSLLVPACNEGATIGSAMKSLLASRYPDLEIVVVNDGSRDATLQTLKNQLDLGEVMLWPRSGLTYQPVLAAYRSRLFPNVIVLDKLNGGKADALNCALAHATGGLVCALDADVLLPHYTLLRAVLPHVEDRKVIATGGMIRPRNHCDITPEREVGAGPSRCWKKSRWWNTCAPSPSDGSGMGHRQRRGHHLRRLRRLQGRPGPDRGGMPALLRGGGHGTRRPPAPVLPGTRTPYKVLFVPDAVCWTEAPDCARDLFMQRNRWQQGLLSDIAYPQKDALPIPATAPWGCWCCPIS